MFRGEEVGMKNPNNNRGTLSALMLALAGIIGCIALPFACQALAASLRDYGSGSIPPAPKQDTSLPLNRWTGNGPKGSLAISLAIDKQDPQIIYERTLAGVFKNQFNGNFADAEMVKAFITSTEYRQRFAHRIDDSQSDAPPQDYSIEEIDHLKNPIALEVLA